LNKDIGVRFIVDKSIEKGPVLGLNKEKSEAQQNSVQVKTEQKPDAEDDNFLNDLLDTFDGKFHTGNE